MAERLFPKAEERKIGFKNQKKAIFSGGQRGKPESGPMDSEGMKTVPRFLVSS